jgi:hypothetical protein
MTTLKDIKNIAHDAATSPGRLCCLPVMDVKRLIAVADAASELVRASHYEAFSSGPVVGSDYVFALDKALEEIK